MPYYLFNEANESCIGISEKPTGGGGVFSIFCNETYQVDELDRLIVVKGKVYILESNEE